MLFGYKEESYDSAFLFDCWLLSFLSYLRERGGSLIYPLVIYSVETKHGIVKLFRTRQRAIDFVISRYKEPIEDLDILNDEYGRTTVTSTKNPLVTWISEKTVE